MFAGWELPLSHCMIVAVGKGIDRAHGMSTNKKQVGLPLTWAMLAQGRQAVVSMEDGGYVMWLLGLVVSSFLLCRVSELWAYANGQAHAEFALTRKSHPTVGVALFGTKVSDRLSSLSEEPALRINILLAYSF